MTSFLYDLSEIDQTSLDLVGGKAANLGELTHIPGVHVPEGFCLSTEAFQAVVGPNIAEPERIQTTPIPAELAEQILARLTPGQAYAVRSSATAEDLPTASFAGLYDSFLNLGKEAVLEHISKCWASLYSERAVAYRPENGFEQVRLAVIVQRMVAAETAGVMFTADPVTSDRTVLAIEAAAGLGDALVSGQVNAEGYRVRHGEIVDKPESGRLSDAQVLELERLGRAIEAHFGCPQDIEWCWADDRFYVVQSRPITTLYPIPEGEEGYRVYLSVAHQQMMTAAMKPLGISIWQLFAARPMYKAGGRLFVDVTPELSGPARAGLLQAMGQHDPLIKDALERLLEREQFGSPEAPVPGAAPAAPPPPDPTLVDELMKSSQEAIASLRQDIKTRSGPELFDFIVEDIQQRSETRKDPHRSSLIMGAVTTMFWLNDKMAEWLGETNVADILSQSAPNNITSEMGLALLDVADAVRPYPAVIAYLQQVDGDDFLDQLTELDGGRPAREAIEGFLDRYGMRCVGEIDITTPRWSERPSGLIPLILSNVRNFDPGEAARRFEQGLQTARAKEQQLLDRLDEPRRDETRRQIALFRSLIGYREYPKYSIVSRLFCYKQALLEEADRLVRDGVVGEREDVFYLTFQEFHEAVRSHQLEAELIARRKAEHRRFDRLTPPRVLTSDGEIVQGRYQRDHLPVDALVGLAVSAGVVEGRARVLLRLDDAELGENDILVTRFTDPSWTPLFVSLKGLVTEVGGRMTHGAVIAREYGLPAVVGVENATRLIADGQPIRVDGTSGTIELL